MMTKKRISGVKDSRIQELDDDEADLELPSASAFFGSHANLVPLQSAVQAPRIFYGARFMNQAMPVEKAEAALVQNLDDQDKNGRSFDEIMGDMAGNVRAGDDDDDAEVIDVTPDEITLKTAKGNKIVDLYNHQPFNRKTSLHNTPLVKPGDRVRRGQVMAKSNYTSDDGTLALGLNARVGLVPYKGYSMDDAIVLSAPFARRLASMHSDTYEQDFDRDIKPGRSHFTSLFPNLFKKEQTAKLDDNGVIKPGMVLNPGDPMILATRPRTISSTTAQLNKLSKNMRQARGNASQVWDRETPGMVTDVAYTNNGVKVVVSTSIPTEKGDKVVFRTGQKGIVSAVLPEEHMPRTLDGEPMDVLLNPLGTPSRVNSAMKYELWLGKVAKKLGLPMKVPSFLPPGTKWFDYVKAEMDKAGVTDAEEVFDPQTNRKLENPIATGYGYIMKLHHLGESKASSRSQGSYDVNDQPVKGSGPGGNCFAAKQVINTINGPVPISQLCEKKMRTHVLSWNDVNNEWVFRPVVDWFVRRADLKDIISVTFNGPCDRGTASKQAPRNYSQSSLQVTKNHEIFTPEGPRKAGDLRTGDCMLVRGPLITQHQHSLLVGTTLGDAHFHKDGDAFRAEHSAKQSDYVKWKQQVLSGLGAVYKSDYTHTSARVGLDKPMRSCAVSFHLPYVTKWGRKLCYSGKDGQKKVTLEWAQQLDELAMAVWFLDDGVFQYKPENSKHNITICTNSFSREELDILRVVVLDKFGISFNVNCRNCLIASNKEETVKMADIVARWVPWDVIPKSKHMLIAWCKEKQAVTPPHTLDVQNPLGRVPVEVLSIEPYVHDKPGIEEINVYDFTVAGTHNYCASYISVSNSKRSGGLEGHAMLSAGAYHNIRESATLRGTRNDAYWRDLRMGLKPKEPGVPFVWNKFRALLSGAGLRTKDMPGGRIRLGPMTDRDLDALQPADIHHGEIVNAHTLDPVKGGLFDPAVASGNKWGRIRLPFSLPQPAAEDSIRKLLGITQKEFDAIMAGKMELPEALRR